MSEPWTVTMKTPFKLDEYCLTTRDSVTYRVILDHNASWPEIVNGYVLDLHHSTKVLYPEALPWVYSGLMLTILIGLFGFMVAFIKQAERIIKGLVDYRLRSHELKQPKVDERRKRPANPAQSELNNG